jgi:hypothetical protein
MTEVPYSIGSPGRAALELPEGAPGSRSGPADVELSAAALPGMLIRAATSRGLLHRGHGTPRQDAFALTSRGGSAVAVVCDGVGQFGRSDEAAALVSRRLADLGAQGIAWPETFACANDQLRKLADEALANQGADRFRDGMATTAVAVAIRREGDDWVGSAGWIGDSTLWHLGQDRTWKLLTGTFDEEPESPYHSSAVRPMPSGDGACSLTEFRVTGGALFVMSDGVSNPLKWSSDVQQALALWWRRPPDALTFAGQVGFARKAHVDDRTVIGLWPDQGDVDGDDGQ